MARELKSYLRTCLRELLARPIEQLLDARYHKFRRMGVWLESPPGEVQPSGNGQRVDAVVEHVANVPVEAAH